MKTNEHKRNIIMHNIYEAIASLERAYDVANDIGLEKTVNDIDAIQHELETIIHEVK